MAAPADLEVHPADLTQVTEVLDAAGKSLHDHASDLDTTPDAGRSTDETAKATLALSAAVAALSQRIGELAENTSAASAAFTGTDQAVNGAMQQHQSVLGP